jgi:hypothetical protein
VDESTTKVAIAAFHADAVKNGYVRELCMSDFDVPGAFLNIELDKTSCPRPIVMRIQDDLPHPLAGKWVLIKKGVYGLKQSNNLFELDIRKQFHAAGFLPLESDPCLYMKVNLLDPSKKCIVSMHVDDGQAIYNDRSLYDELISVLEKRYGALTHNAVTSSFLGQGIHRSDKGGVTLTMEGYISQLCQKFNILPEDKASSPSDKDLFHDTSFMPAVDITLYQKIIGGLIYVLKNRSDVRKEVIYLATKTSDPNMGDLIKCIRVLKYLNTTKKLGPTFYTEEGVVLYGCVDAAYGVHSDGRSQTGYYISIGRYSAPICCYTSAQNACVSQSSMEAEYVALSELGKKIIHFRNILSELGFPQNNPTIIYEDNKSAIKLATNIQVTRKSRHINIRHHYIRDIIRTKEVIIVHLPSNLMTSDMLTKPLGPTKFKPFCKILLNMEHFFAGPLRNNILVDPPKSITQHLIKTLGNKKQSTQPSQDQRTHNKNSIRFTNQQ